MVSILLDDQNIEENMINRKKITPGNKVRKTKLKTSEDNPTYFMEKK